MGVAELRALLRSLSESENAKKDVEVLHRALLTLFVQASSSSFHLRGPMVREMNKVTQHGAFSLQVYCFLCLILTL